MSKLGVNVDHVATIREARKIDYPDPVSAALLCETAGADSIVCHLREDRRHIHERDLYKLKDLLSIKLNLEMAASEEIIRIALKARPEQVTLVPERRRELTTEGGLDARRYARRLREVGRRMEKKGIGMSLFIDPDKRQIKAARQTGARMIELHTGAYANAKNKNSLEKEYRVLRDSAQFAKKIGFLVFAGHGLNYDNTARLRKISEIEEYNIGHAIVARSIFVGIEKATREMRALVR